MTIDALSYRIRWFILTFFFIPALACANFFAPTTERVVSRAVNAFMHDNKVPGVAVEIVTNGKAEGYYYGYANLDNHVPVNEKTIFEIGSLSKLMTTLLLAERINYAKMSLADPITKYLPTLPTHFSKITLQNLATHTAGLPFNVPKTVQTETQFNAYLARIAPTIQPNVSWRYSNLGIELLARAIESETQKPIDKLYHDNISEIINTLSMNAIPSERYQQNVAQGYSETNQMISPSTLDLLSAAWALKISAVDMQRFLAAAVGVADTPTSILYPMKMTQVAYVRLPHSMQGLGWNLHRLDHYLGFNTFSQPKDVQPIMQMIIQPLFQHKVLIDKTGQTDGFRSYIAVLPDKETGVVILANKAVDEEKVESLGRTILFDISK